jgi:hypothetical protein
MTAGDLVKALSNPVSAIVYLALGGVGVQLWRRYLTRLATFRYSVLHTRLANAAEDPRLGTVEVLWNKLPVRNLHFCTIEFENESSRDFSNVVIRIAYPEGTRILAEGQVSGSTQYIPWTDHYRHQIAAMSETEEAERDQVQVELLLARREYVIPIMNRGMKFSATWLVSSDNADPTVFVACDHLGVRLYERPQRPMMLGVVQMHAAWLGTLAALLLTIAVTMGTKRLAIVVPVAFLSAGFAPHLGALIIHVKRWSVRAIG